jgi:hypothetical protein
MSDTIITNVHKDANGAPEVPGVDMVRVLLYERSAIVVWKVNHLCLRVELAVARDGCRKLSALRTATGKKDRMNGEWKVRLEGVFRL